MPRFQWIAIPVAAAGAVAMAASIYAATPSTPPRLPFGTTFWQAVAKQVGVSAARLEAAVEAELKAQRNSLAHGGFQARGGQGGAAAQGNGGFADEVAIGQYVVQSAAKYIGVTPSALTKDIAGGASIESVATAHHKSIPGLVAVVNKAVADVLKTKG